MFPATYFTWYFFTPGYFQSAGGGGVSGAELTALTVRILNGALSRSYLLEGHALRRAGLTGDTLES